MSKTGASFNKGRSKQDYSTPGEFIGAVCSRFGHIGFDLACNDDNSVVSQGFDEEDNSLEQDWHDAWCRHEGWLWLNPPFRNIAPWAAKCAQEMRNGADILLLTPASVGTNWFNEHVRPNAYVLELTPRICFDGKSPFMKDCLLSVFTYGGLPGRASWKWK